MKRLEALYLSDNDGFSCSDVVRCEAWRQLNLPQPPEKVFEKRGLCVIGQKF